MENLVKETHQNKKASRIPLIISYNRGALNISKIMNKYWHICLRYSKTTRKYHLHEQKFHRTDGRECYF